MVINQVHGSPSASRDEPELRAVNRIHGGAVEVPGLGTPGQRRAESEGRRGGRPRPLAMRSSGLCGVGSAGCVVFFVECYLAQL